MRQLENWFYAYHFVCSPFACLDIFRNFWTISKKILLSLEMEFNFKCDMLFEYV